MPRSGPRAVRNYSDDVCAAFMGIRSVNSGHALVVPVSHATHLADLSEATAGRLMQLAHRVAAAIRGSGLRCGGINMFLADGAGAGQEVFHCHMHVFPRYQDDGLGLRFGPHYSDLPARADLEHASTRIQGALHDEFARPI